MKTPIFDFTEKYSESNVLRLHMPGHKGNGETEKNDITEINGADVLYSAKGIIAESEKNAADIFGTAKTVYSAEGSSLSIKATVYMLNVYAKSLGKRPLVAAGRNAHKTFTSALGLTDTDVVWLCPRGNGIIGCDITPEYLEDFLKDSEELPVAVYVTSPDYLGKTADIGGLSRVCKKYGVLLAVDNAHGAYLKFTEPSRHPIDLGAELCCDSAHKTLPVLTGGAYLHISEVAPSFFTENAERAMSLFATTSPSYLILRSLDRVNPYLAEEFPRKLRDFAKSVEKLKAELTASGHTLYGDEPMKITLLPKAFGYTGEELAALLSKKSIECEFADRDSAVMMLSPEITEAGLEKIRDALLSVTERAPITEKAPEPHLPKKAISVREALFSASELTDIEECVGKIAADVSVSCPPAIPIIVCGERFDEKTVETFKYYGITESFTVKE